MESEIIFEWDEEKNKNNIEKHGLDFCDAIYVFSDPNYIESYDVFHSDAEDRYVVIGCVGKVIIVIYTLRNDVYRIISARIANKKEEELYYDTKEIKNWF